MTKVDLMAEPSWTAKHEVLTRRGGKSAPRAPVLESDCAAHARANPDVSVGDHNAGDISLESPGFHAEIMVPKV